MSSDTSPPPSPPAPCNGAVVLAMLAAHDVADGGDDAVHPLSWWLAGGNPPPPSEHRRELAAHGHPHGWLESLRELYAGRSEPSFSEPSFSATSMAILARYALLIDRPTWDLLARGVEGDGDDAGMGTALESWVAAHPVDEDDDGDDSASDDSASWAPESGDAGAGGDGSTP